MVEVVAVYIISIVVAHQLATTYVISNSLLAQYKKNKSRKIKKRTTIFFFIIIIIIHGLRSFWKLFLFKMFFFKSSSICRRRFHVFFLFYTCKTILSRYLALHIYMETKIKDGKKGIGRGYIFIHHLIRVEYITNGY